jgi:hypothetical protein
MRELMQNADEWSKWDLQHLLAFNSHWQQGGLK